MSTRDSLLETEIMFPHEQNKHSRQLNLQTKQLHAETSMLPLLFNRLKEQMDIPFQGSA